MTDTEIRQLKNDRDYWRRKAEAVERKYAPLKGRSFLACVAHRIPAGWTADCIYIEDAADQVTDSNYLHGLHRDLLAGMSPEARARSEQAQEGAKP